MVGNRGKMQSSQPTSKETTMRKTEILQARVQVLNAFTKAWDSKVPFSMLIRKEWQWKGYIPVPAENMA